MTVPVEIITRERLAEWAEILDAGHATPAVLVGVGHDARAGELHICIPEDLSTALVRHCLLMALAHLDSLCAP